MSPNEESPLRSELRPEDLSFLDSAPLAATVELAIAAGPETIWPAIADAALWTEWFPGIKEARYTSAQPHGEGSIRFVSVGPLKANEVVLAFEPLRRFAFRVTDANLPGFSAIVEEITLEPKGSSTVVRYRQATELKAPLSLLGPLIRPQLRRTLRKGLAGLDRWVSDLD